MQNFQALEAPPPDPVPPAARGPQPPAAGVFAPAPIGLRQLEATPPDPQISPTPIANFWLCAWFHFLVKTFFLVFT